MSDNLSIESRVPDLGECLSRAFFLEVASLDLKKLGFTLSTGAGLLKSSEVQLFSEDLDFPDSC